MWTLYEMVLGVGVLLYLPKAVWRRRLPHRGFLLENIVDYRSIFVEN